MAEVASQVVARDSHVSGQPEYSPCVVEGRVYPIDGLSLSMVPGVGLVHHGRELHTTLGDPVLPSSLPIARTFDSSSRLDEEKRP